MTESESGNAHDAKEDKDSNADKPAEKSRRSFLKSVTALTGGMFISPNALDSSSTDNPVEERLGVGKMEWDDDDLDYLSEHQWAIEKHRQMEELGFLTKQPPRHPENQSGKTNATTNDKTSPKKSEQQHEAAWQQMWDGLDFAEKEKLRRAESSEGTSKENGVG